jgi:hypothetical protein
MNIILQNASTRQYVGPDGWTSKMKEAYPFPTSARALAHCSQENLVNMNCIYSFPNVRHNFTMPIEAMTTCGPVK